MSPTVAITHLGCKLNQAEVESLTRQFAFAGYMIVDAEEPADVFILNSCTVTSLADRKSRQLHRARADEERSQPCEPKHTGQNSRRQG